MVYRTEEEKLGTVLFAIDESGSMGDDDVRDAIGIVIQAKDYYKSLFVIKHDYNIGWKKLYETVDDVNIDELLERKHCGGTSHKEVFEFINDFVRRDSDNMVSAYIGITDMDSDIERCQNNIPFGIPVIYITNNDRKHPKVEGKIIKINAT